MIHLLKAEPHHAEEMHLIEAEAFAAPWSEISIRYEIMNPLTIAFIAEENERILGHAYMQHILDEGHIINIAVRKSHRKCGIGSLLVSELITAARNAQIRGLTLEVRESNTAAISLYKKNGFTAEGIRKNYYANPTENGIVMWKYL
ncbi:MAG: ribosomal protein S18-alanine N-acetyltransferase [Defluviitaleaceae bacterium]|nr:ribosomal protein S18-alanine N-acetyltransferase [Defluviitaleaceae bacterium]MCL2263726.1 ribosomal protein S18-alanine N-acetyltransferase [Defluviitaleaceae bacterium]